MSKEVTFIGELRIDHDFRGYGPDIFVGSTSLTRALNAFNGQEVAITVKAKARFVHQLSGASASTKAEGTNQ